MKVNVSIQTIVYIFLKHAVPLKLLFINTVLSQLYLFWFCMAQLEAKLTVGTGDEESETEYGKSVISLKKKLL